MGKKIRVSYFSMKNPYTKFQNPSLHGSEVMLCSNGQTDAQTNARTNVPEAICPSNFFEVGGINIRDTISQFHWVGNVNRYVHAKQITFYKRFKSYRNFHKIIMDFQTVSLKLFIKKSDI